MCMYIYCIYIYNLYIYTHNNMLYERIESYDPMLASEGPQAPAMPRPQPTLEVWVSCVSGLRSMDGLGLPLF